MPIRKQQPARKTSLRGRLARPSLEALEDRLVLSSATPLPATAGASGAAFSSTDILVQYRTSQPAIALPGTTVGAKLDLVSNLYEINLTGGVSVAQALAAYSASPTVADAEPDYTLSASDFTSNANFAQQWSLQNTGQQGGKAGADIGAVQAWNSTTGSRSIIVAVADTGVDYDHPDLYQNIWINQSAIPASRLKNLVDVFLDGFISMRDLNSPINQGPGKIQDFNGDGHIDAGDLLQPMILNAQGQDTGRGGWVNPRSPDAGNGLIGWNFSANNDNPNDDDGHGTHVAGIIGATGSNGGTYGVDPNVQIMPIKFLDANGHGSISQYIEGLNYAVEHGAKIINNSWTGAEPSGMLIAAVANAQAHGVIFVAAAGNDGKNNDAAPVYPASFDKTLNNVVSVAATDRNDALAGFSNYGPTSVTLAAPGVDILSTVPTGYAVDSGTSMATPEVAGVMALVWSEHPDWNYLQVINRVLSTTDKLPSLQGKVSTGGRLDAAAAVGAAATSSTGPRVISAIASGPTAYSLSTIQVTFDRSIAVSTFTPDDLGLFGPTGKPIAVTDVKAVAGSGNRTFNLTFAVQTTAGSYTLYVGTNARDLAGDRITGFQTTFKVTAAPRPTPVVTPAHVISATASGPAANTLSTIQITFDRAIAAATLTPDDLGFFGPNGKLIPVIDVKVAAGSANRTFAITFATQTAAGSYTLYVGTNAKDPDDNRITGYQKTFTLTAPVPTKPAPAHVISAAASGPTAYSLSTIQITFDRAIAAATLTPDDLGFFGPNGKPITGIEVKAVAGSSNRTFVITFATQTAAGSYTLYVGTNAKDPDGNRIAGYQGTFKVVAAPAPPKPTTSVASFTATTAAAIPPEGRGVSLLKIDSTDTIASLTVKVNIQYPHAGDLYIHLQAPDGTNIVLSNQRGGTTANLLNTTFSDKAATSIFFASGSLSGGTFQPQNMLSQLAGKSTAGVWKLWVENRGGGSGTLLNWSLTVTSKAN